MGSSEWSNTYSAVKLKPVPVAEQMGADEGKMHPTASSQITVRNQVIGQTVKLTKGLVGTRCIVSISEKKVNCLLDTGSQVTTVPLSFYKKHLTNQAIIPLNN